MEMEIFKQIHSELIQWVQYIEHDLRIIFATISPGGFNENHTKVDNAPLGKLLKELRNMDKEVGYSKLKEEDYELLDQIREIRNYWCHQCFLDFHYIEDHQKKYKKWLELTERLHYDEDRVYNLYQKIEKLRKNVEKKYKYRKKG